MRSAAGVMTIGLASLLVSGCTSSLQSESLSPTANRVGIGYVLPFTQYAMSVTWRLDYCPADAAAEEKAARVVVKTEATRGSADDATLAYMIDPNDLQSITNITTFGAKWIDGTNQLSSINASVEDRTGQIIGNLTKTAVSAIKLLAGPGGGSDTYTPCSDTAKAALAKAKTAKAELDLKTAAVEAATEELGSIKKVVEALGDSIDDATKKRYADAITKLTTAQETQNDAAEALAKAQKAISFTRKFSWPADGNTFSSGGYDIDPTILTKWIPGGKAPKIFLQIDRIGSFGRSPTQPGIAAPDSKLKGLRYRMPAKGQLLACTKEKCGLNSAVGVDQPAYLDQASILANFEGPIAQLGYVNVLSFKTRTFGTNSFSAEFNSDASLKSVAFEQKAAALEQATGVLADTTSQLATALDPTTRLKAKTDYLKALKDQRDAQTALVPAAADPNAQSVSSLNSETSLLNAQIANLEAQIALDALKAKRPQ